MAPSTRVWLRSAIYAALMQAVCLAILLVLRDSELELFVVFVIAFPAALLLIPVLGNTHTLETWFIFAVLIVNWLVYTPFFRALLLLRRKRSARLT